MSNLREDVTTSGGSTTSPNSASLCIGIEEGRIGVREEVGGACEMLGLGRLYVADEGRLVADVAAGAAGAVVARMRGHAYGRDACVIGEVRAEPRGIVAMRTGFGGTRIADVLAGEQLPRICRRRHADPSHRCRFRVSERTLIRTTIASGEFLNAYDPWRLG